jgi:hypothetical protein
LGAHGRNWRAISRLIGPTRSLAQVRIDGESPRKKKTLLSPRFFWCGCWQNRALPACPGDAAAYEHPKSLARVMDKSTGGKAGRVVRGNVRRGGRPSPDLPVRSCPSVFCAPRAGTARIVRGPGHPLKSMREMHGGPGWGGKAEEAGARGGREGEARCLQEERAKAAHQRAPTLTNTTSPRLSPPSSHRSAPTPRNTS